MSTESVFGMALSALDEDVLNVSEMSGPPANAKVWFTKCEGSSCQSKRKNMRWWMLKVNGKWLCTDCRKD